MQCVGLLWRRRPTSAGPGRGVEVVLMGAVVVLAFSEQQHLGGVAAGRADAGHVARQALTVTRCRRYRGQRGGQRGRNTGLLDPEII